MIKKNSDKKSLTSSEWMVFEDNRTVHFQPVGANYLVDVHSIKTRAGYYLPIPCGLDDRGSCYLCDTYPIRVVLFWSVFDHGDDLRVKRMKLSKSAARQLLGEIDDREPTNCIIKAERWTPNQSSPSHVKFRMEVDQDDAKPVEAFEDDIYSDLITWMDPEFQKGIVPNFKNLKPKFAGEGIEEAEAYANESEYYVDILDRDI